MEWQEVVSIIRTNRWGGCIVIETRKGNVFNWMHGVLFRSWRPIIILHPSLEERETLIQEISEQTGLPIRGKIR